MDKSFDNKDIKSVRLDKWLWAARFFKTRSEAHKAIDNGKVTIDGIRAKASREVYPGQKLTINLSHAEVNICIKDVSDRRGSGQVALLLYEESPESILRRENLRKNALLNRAIAPDRKPDSHDRKSLRRVRGKE